MSSKSGEWWKNKGCVFAHGVVWSLKISEVIMWMHAEHSTSTDAGNAGMASGGVSNIRGQGILLRVWVLRCSRHSLWRRWPPLLQGLLYWRLHWFHLWERQVHVQGHFFLPFFHSLRFRNEWLISFKVTFTLHTPLWQRVFCIFVQTIFESVNGSVS